MRASGFYLPRQVINIILIDIYSVPRRMQYDRKSESIPVFLHASCPFGIARWDFAPLYISASRPPEFPNSGPLSLRRRRTSMRSLHSH